MNEVIYPNGLSREGWLKLIEERKNHFYRYPDNADQKIWRYMDFTKFVALLEGKSLFFPRATLLDDQYEGSVSQETIKKLYQTGEKMIESFKKGIPDGKFTIDKQDAFRSNFDSFAKWQSESRRWSRDWTYISCWHMNDYESAAMWSLYATSNQAIAIQSTFKRLYDCLLPHVVPPKAEPKLGIVYYIDYNNQMVSNDASLSEYFYKRKSFQHETELRAVIQELPFKNGKTINDLIGQEDEDYDKKPITGKSLNVDIENLIEQIYVAPTSPEWFFNLTKKMLDRYGLNKPVQRSSLDNDPVF